MGVALTPSFYREVFSGMATASKADFIRGAQFNLDAGIHAATDDHFSKQKTSVPARNQVFRSNALPTDLTLGA